MHTCFKAHSASAIRFVAAALSSLYTLLIRMPCRRESGEEVGSTGWRRGPCSGRLSTCSRLHDEPCWHASGPPPKYRKRRLTWYRSSLSCARGRVASKTGRFGGTSCATTPSPVGANGSVVLRCCGRLWELVLLTRPGVYMVLPQAECAVWWLVREGQ